MDSSDGSLFTSGTSDTFTLVQPPQTIAILGEDNRTPLVTIHATGELEYGPDYQPDEAARRFWDAMRHHMLSRCERCGHMPGRQAD